MAGLPDILDKFKIPLALSFLGLVLIIGGLAFSANPKTKVESFPKESLVQEQKSLQVDISGAINNPGVYKLSQNSRVEDAINMAGGLSDSANFEYISKYINLAQKLSDGMKIYLPKKGEESVPVTAIVSGVSASKIVNINSATQAELEALPGIGAVTAAKIVSGRPYQKVEDLLEQKIIGKSVFEKIKESITIN